MCVVAILTERVSSSVAAVSTRGMYVGRGGFGEVACGTEGGFIVVWGAHCGFIVVLVFIHFGLLVCLVVLCVLNDVNALCISREAFLRGTQNLFKAGIRGVFTKAARGGDHYFTPHEID